MVPVQGGGRCGSGEMRGEDANHRPGQQDRDSPGKPSRCVPVKAQGLLGGSHMHNVSRVATLFKNKEIHRCLERKTKEDKAKC